MARRPPAAAEDWLTRASLLGAALLVLIGGLAMVGWAERIDLLVQLQSNYTPIQPNTAASMIACGLALLGLEFGVRRALWLAAVPAALGGLTILQYVAGWNLHVDDLLQSVYITIDPTYPGRMPRLTSAAVCAGGLSLLWRAYPLWTRHRPMILALVASLIASLGLAPLLGWALGLSVSSAWSQVIRPAPLPSLSLALLGGLLLSRVWREDPDRAADLPGWLPAPVVAAGVTLTLLFTAALRDHELNYLRGTIQLTANNAATVLNFELDSQARALERMATRWAQIDQGSDAQRDRDGAAYVEDFPALRSLTWIDPTMRTGWFYPKAGNEALFAYDHGADPLHRQLIDAVRKSGEPAYSPLIRLPLGGQGFLICVPLPAGAGELLGEYVYPALLEGVEKRLQLSALYAVTIDIDGQRVFERHPPGAVRRDLQQEARFNLFNQHVRIGLTPSAQMLERNRQSLPELVTAFGLGLSVLLGMVAHLARAAHVRRRSAERANARLVAENEERRRAEQALRASQAATRKLSLVASGTDNLVAIADAGGRIEWVNESFARLLGVSLSEALGRPLAQLLVSPDTEPPVVASLRDALVRGSSFNGDLLCHARDGRRYTLHLEMHPVRNEAGGVENLIAMLTDVTARVETERFLRRAKEEADAASRAKSEFLASMSHEIRTPMNGVIGMTSLLLDTPLNSDQRDCVNTIRTSGDALLAIINDILDFSKIESGKMELEQRPFELAACMEEALDLFAVQAAAKHIDLAYFIEPEVPAWIVGDPTRLRQVVVNFVNNAVKFTPHGYVSVEVGLADASRPPMFPGGTAPTPPWSEEAGTCLLQFAVRDTGIGIPPEKQRILFKPFTQVDSSTTRKYGGTGLGLAICQRLCELMGGEIRVESTPGHGSLFTFVIQIRPASPPAAVPPTAVPASLRARPVLVVDDHAASRRFVATTLSGAGLTCESADSAATALQAMERRPPPALLIVDQVLPNEDGRRLVTELRRRAGWPPPPVLVLLPAGEAVPRAWLDNLAPAAHLFKPLKVGPLLAAIRSLFTPGPAAEGAQDKAGRLLSEEIPLDILLVEDNPVNQTVALSLLTRLGYKAQAAPSGAEALQALETRPCQLVLMDVQMPEMNGLDCTREIRRRLPPERQPCIVAVTANALVGDRELCLAAGMNDYLTKPLKLDQLASAIRRNFPGRGAG